MHPKTPIGDLLPVIFTEVLKMLQVADPIHKALQGMIGRKESKDGVHECM